MEKYVSGQPTDLAQHGGEAALTTRSSLLMTTASSATGWRVLSLRGFTARTATSVAEALEAIETTAARLRRD